MKRGPSRAPSPTPTSFSGISNYRNTDSYRSANKNAPAVPTADYRSVSKTHFDELSRYLAVYLAKSPPNSRTTARQKLTRLTIQQFHELSTDVYDELMRRKNENEVPFLPVREDFHPKRNQARQKLATLPTSRFEDLSSDVYYELSRRYPEFKEDPSGRGSVASAYDDSPAPEFYAGSPPLATSSRTSGRTSADRPSDSGYGGSGPSRKPSVDRRRTNDSDYYPSRRSEDTYRKIDDAYVAQGRISEDGHSTSSRRRPSQDIPRRSEDRDRATNVGIDHGRRPSGSASVGGMSDTTTTGSTGAGQSATATSGMIIPTKSTMEEEYIEIPYGRELQESGGTLLDEHDRGRDTGKDHSMVNTLTDGEPDSASDYPSPMSPLSPPVGLSGLSARLKGMEDDDDEVAIPRGDDYHDKFGRSSVNSDRSASGGAGSRTLPGWASATEEQEKLRRDYEYKIATLQGQISSLQRDAADAADKDRRLRESETRAKQLEDELAVFRRRAEEQAAVIRTLQKDLDELRDARQREKDRESRRAVEDEDELQILRERLERLEEEKQVEMDAGQIDNLRSDLEGLVSELTDLSRRNDELMAAKESDAKVIRELDNQLKEYKRKYEQAKTELRTVKATSQLFLQPPKFDDQLPYSSDGGILDIHITAFQSAIDNLLTLGRSNAPTRVLQPMKSVVNAVTAIIDDVRAYERKAQRDHADVDVDSLQALRERADATLSNLTVASKTHATSSGMSPVSLLDAAASHVSVTITEMGKATQIRKATKVEQEKFATTQHAPNSTTGGFVSSLRSIDETKSTHQRKTSATSASSSRGRYYGDTTSPHSRPVDIRRRPQSDNSSSEQTNSPPPIFDQQNLGGGMSDDSLAAEGPEDNWAELTRYLDVQTGAIVVAIQGVLTGVRSATPSPSLNENLTQIITIVSSIVAVCKDNLPPNSVQQGNDILRDLSEHANRLSEVQALPELTKESRQIMAKSSYAIANAMKALMKL
ncbi:hypothetical protein AX15_003258 [Amanita polypyramis BW_CC]|nr:hypothetical protein AX15_003258 [Amanita polypyramis BW_CC]